MKLTILCILVFLQIILASEDWHTFKTTYGKIYKSVKEENYRKGIFLKNVKLVEEQNTKYEQGLSSFSIKINKFADLLEEEIFSPPESNTKEVKGIKKQSRSVMKEDVPESIDWRDYGVITPISNQELCESCWAFAVVGTVEAHMGIYRQQNVSLSQQNLVDCVDPTFTCGRYLEIDLVDRTYQYIIDNNGIDTLDSYPYEFYTVGACRYTEANVGATIVSYESVPEGDEEELKRVVGLIGPVTVTLTADIMWNLYQSGVYYKEDCFNTTEPFNHVVVIIGYGNENGEDYWLIRNSWGTWFGEDGYMKMARNRDNNCGVATYGRYPLM